MLKTNHFYLILVVFSLALSCYSQNKTIDSLTRQLSTHSKPDTIKVNLLNKLAEQSYPQDPAKALKLLAQSEKIATHLNYSTGKMECFLQLGKIYTAEKDYEKVAHYLTEGSIIANKLDNKKYKKLFFLLLSESSYDKSKGLNNESVNEHARNIAAEIKFKYFLKDSLDNTIDRENSLKETVRLKETELKLAAFEIYLWIAGVLILVLMLVFILSQMNARKIKMQNKQLQTEQKLRRSQMNPHFIFNSIQNIRSLIADKQEAEAIDYLNTFSALTRQILESSEENYTSLSEEVELIRNYIALQQLLHANKFTYTIKVDEEIDADAMFLPTMISQPFIENAIKHGLSQKGEKGLLSIHFYLKEKRLYFEVTDNGSGFAAEKKQHNHKSMAMEITRKRLAHYTKNKDFVVQAENILDAGKKITGAKIRFEIPYIYEN